MPDMGNFQDDFKSNARHKAWKAQVKPDPDDEKPKEQTSRLTNVEAYILMSKLPDPKSVHGNDYRAVIPPKVRFDTQMFLRYEDPTFRPSDSFETITAYLGSINWNGNPVRVWMIYDGGKVWTYWKGNFLVQ